MTGTKSWVGRTNEAPEPADEVGFMKKPPAGCIWGSVGVCQAKTGRRDVPGSSSHMGRGRGW